MILTFKPKKSIIINRSLKRIVIYKQDFWGVFRSIIIDRVVKNTNLSSKDLEQYRFVVLKTPENIRLTALERAISLSYIPNRNI